MNREYTIIEEGLIALVESLRAEIDQINRDWGKQENEWEDKETIVFDYIAHEIGYKHLHKIGELIDEHFRNTKPNLGYTEWIEERYERFNETGS